MTSPDMTHPLWQVIRMTLGEVQARWGVTDAELWLNPADHQAIGGPPVIMEMRACTSVGILPGTVRVFCRTRLRYLPTIPR